MKPFPGAKRFVTFLIGFSLFSGILGGTPANAISGPDSTSNNDSLFSSEALASPESLGRVERDSVKAARAHLVRNASEWGINPTQFKPSLAIDGVAGMTTVRFTQSINEVEVANSLIALTVNSTGSLLSHTKSISDFSDTSTSAISKEQATESLKVMLAESYRVPTENIIISKIDLVIVDSALVDEVPSGKYLAWRASTSKINDVSSSAITYMSQDGQTLLSSLPLIRGVNNTAPFVCDLQQADQNTPGVFVDQVTNQKLLNVTIGNSVLPLCGPTTSGYIADPANVAVVSIDRTWEYFYSVLGIDINQVEYLGNVAPTFNGNETSRISAFVNVCLKDGDDNYCPYVNAFWVPWVSSECSTGACSGIFLGQGFERADDVIAHELAHGVTFALAFNSAMADSSETAALSEALSDIFGEAMDQRSVLPGEAPDPNWSMGEDAQAGGFRNLRNPDVMKIDKKWRPGRSHDNSGPVNRLAYLLANGGKVGKVKVKALGSTANSVTKNNLCDVPSECAGTVRMSQLVFAAASNLSATANYFDFGKQMMVACTAFVTNGTPGFKKSTCKNVAAALKAQGFTAMKVTGMTKLGKVSRGVDTEVTAAVTGTTGAPVVGQAMQMQVKVSGKWKTVGTANTNGAGVVGFVVKWPRSTTYRIISKTNGGVFTATGKSAKVKVK